MESFMPRHLLVLLFMLATGGITPARAEPEQAGEQRASAKQAEDERLQGMARTARMLVRERRMEEAAETYVRLWEAATSEGYSSFWRTMLTGGEGRWLVVQSPEARRAFSELRDRRSAAIQPRALLGKPRELQQALVLEWLQLSDLLGDNAAIAGWVRSAMEEPAGWRIAELNKQEFEAPLRTERAWTELAWIYDSPVAAIAEQLNWRVRSRELSAQFGTPSSRALDLLTAPVRRRIELERLALVYVAFRGAGQADEANKAWEAIRRGENSGAMRLAVVSLLIEGGLVETSDKRFLDEAEAEGLDVSAFRTRMAEALNENPQAKPEPVGTPKAP
jgi:hypothetical protein